MQNTIKLFYYTWEQLNIWPSAIITIFDDIHGFFLKGHIFLMPSVQLSEVDGYVCCVPMRNIFPNVIISQEILHLENALTVPETL